MQLHKFFGPIVRLASGRQARLRHQICVCSKFAYHHDARTTDAQRSLFSLKYRTFGLGQTNWVDKFWGIWGIFGQTISTHFGIMSPLSMLSIIQPLFLQKTLYPHPKYLFGIGILIWAAKN